MAEFLLPVSNTFLYLIGVLFAYNLTLSSNFFSPNNLVGVLDIWSALGLSAGF